MKHFYLSSTNGLSGICKYSSDFYNLVLKDEGYIFMDSKDSISSILSRIGSRDHVHIELGIFQQKEIELLFLMLRANYKNVSVTLHDAPLLKYPFRSFRNPVMNKLSKCYDIFGNNFSSAIPYIKKIKSIYTLSQSGAELVKKKYRANEVHYLPHIVDLAEIQKSAQSNRNFIYFGFIGRNKGIEYSLQLHEQLLKKYPDILFYVVGMPIGREKAFYSRLQKRFQKNVLYTGYVPDDQLNQIFNQATFALIPFKDYKFFIPFSGSLLYSLKKGKIVFTSKVNAIPEIIENEKRGFYLSGNITKDLAAVNHVFTNTALQERIKNEVYEYLMTNHSPLQVKKHFKG
jgi:glycosyltransferase involved in cell wall biosynthesis